MDEGQRIATRLSPNCGPRRDGLKPSLIVIHFTAMQGAEAAIERLCDSQAEVSAHYVISNTGQITRLVPEEQRAWHAGQGSWAGMEDINSRSVGIELDHLGNHPFPEPQMTALEGLLPLIMERWNIGPAGVIGHSDMAPGRKSDPGPHFDWARLAKQGLAADLQDRTPETVSEAGFIAAARASGFTADVPFEVLLEAVRLRCGPWRTGGLTRADYWLP